MYDQGEMKSFHINFNIYWLYHGILYLLYRKFINTLTNSLQNIVRKSSVTKCFDRLIILDYVRPIHLIE